MISTSETVNDDVRQFRARMSEERINMKNIGLDMELDEQFIKNSLFFIFLESDAYFVF